MRDSLGIAAMPDSAVQVVTADSVCADAVAAHSVRRPPPSGAALQQLLVIRIGSSRYAVYDGYTTAGEYLLYDIYTDQFAYIGSLTM